MPSDAALPLRWTLQTAEKCAEQPGVAADADLAALVPAHAAVLFRVANSLLRNPAAAEDCVQDAFLRVACNPALLAGLTEPRAWLIRVTWNLALDRRRRARSPRTHEQADDICLDSLISTDVPADRQLAERRRLAATLREIDALPAREREALLLSALDDLSPSEIAAALGRTPSATRALLHRARTRLRERLTRKGLA